jgi:hypothetical protein
MCSHALFTFVDILQKWLLVTGHLGTVNVRPIVKLLFTRTCWLQPLMQETIWAKNAPFSLHFIIVKGVEGKNIGDWGSCG